MKKLLLLSLSLLCLTSVTSCNEKPKDEPDQPISLELVLSSSERYLLADGVKTITLTVVNSGVNVTDKARIMTLVNGKSQPVGGSVYKTTEPGNHEFYAIYNGMLSARISILAAAAMPEPPIDAMPAKYDGLRKRALASQQTGLWCTYCPRLMKAMHDFNATDPKADDVVFVAAHVQDIFESDKSTAIDITYNSSGLPNLIFSLSADKANQSTMAATPKDIRNLANKFLATPALTAISAASELKDKLVCVRADIKVAEKGKFLIGAFLLEDGQTATQTNGSGLKEDYFNTHNNILRNGYPAKTMYEEIGGLKEIAAKTKHQFYCQFTTKDVADLTKTRVVVFTFNPATNLVDNAVVFKVGEKIAFSYL